MTNIQKLRNKINKTDGKILELISQRLEAAKEIGEIKKETKLKIKDTKREEEVLENLLKKAESLNLSKNLIKNIWKLLFNESYKVEK